MHDFVIEEYNGSLGYLKETLNVGDKQCFFNASDEGPFWMPKEKYGQKQFDRKTGKLKGSEEIA
eukprot:9303812-Ditylum_brightwellii.AAC.1